MKPRHVACPTCSREIEWTEAQRWRPFCSERCQLIDLGAWFEEKHAVPGEPVDAGENDAALDREREQEINAGRKPRH